MYFDIYINDSKVATVGPSDLEHLSISVSGHEGTVYLSANGLSAKEEGQRYFTWLDQELGGSDAIRVVPSKESNASPPQSSRNIRRGQIASEENRFCDFCKRAEEEVGSLIQAGETPYICVQCAELCIDIAKGWEDEA